MPCTTKLTNNTTTNSELQRATNETKGRKRFKRRAGERIEAKETGDATAREPESQNSDERDVSDVAVPMDGWMERVC